MAHDFFWMMAGWSDEDEAVDDGRSGDELKEESTTVDSSAWSLGSLSAGPNQLNTTGR